MVKLVKIFKGTVHLTPRILVSDLYFLALIEVSMIH